MIANTFWFRHFLLCDQLAKKMCALRGWTVYNFAEVIQEEEWGRTANEQMTVYFWEADTFFAELHESDNGIVFDVLEDEANVSMEILRSLTEKEISEYYENYCVGKINFQITKQ